MVVTTELRAAARLPPDDRGAAVRRAQPRLLGLRRRTATASCRRWRLRRRHGPRALRLPVPRARRSTPRHERFVLDHNRCILCTRCVRVCDEVEGAHTWDVSGRGIDAQRDHRPQRSPGASRRRCTSCGKCVQVCPTGALFEKVRPQGRDGQEPRLPRLHQDRAGEEAMDPVKEAGGQSRRVATVWLGGCSGCHMSFARPRRAADRAGAAASISCTARSWTSRSSPRTSTSTLVEGADLQRAEPARGPA